VIRRDSTYRNDIVKIHAQNIKSSVFITMNSNVPAALHHTRHQNYQEAAARAYQQCDRLKIYIRSVWIDKCALAPLAGNTTCTLSIDPFTYKWVSSTSKVPLYFRYPAVLAALKRFVRNSRETETTDVVEFECGIGGLAAYVHHAVRHRIRGEGRVLWCLRTEAIIPLLIDRRQRRGAVSVVHNRHALGELDTEVDR